MEKPGKAGLFLQKVNHHSYFFLATASLRALPGRNLGTLAAAILISLPVCGFLPVRAFTSPDGGHHVICQGEHRFRIAEFLDGYPFFVARVERVLESDEKGTEIEARLLNLRNQALEVLQLLPNTPAELVAPACVAEQVFHFRGPL